MKIALIGAGSWALALAIGFTNQIDKKKDSIYIWGYSKEENEQLIKTRKSKFIDTKIDDDIIISNDIKYVVEDADLVFNVTPSAHAVEVFKQYYKYLKKDAYVINCTKGFDPETHKFIYDVFAEYIPSKNLGVLSGPTHAEEVSKDIISTIVIASENEDLQNKVIALFNPKKMRVYKSSDVQGVQVGGALKNIIALCAGVVDGLDKGGDNTFAALCTRGLVEINRFSKLYNAQEKTIYGLSGLGDLIVTCKSMHSRNKRAGILLAKGKNIKDIQNEIGMVIEGIDNVQIATAIARENNIEMPIVFAVNSILFEDVSINDAMDKLMTRTLREE